MRGCINRILMRGQHGGPTVHGPRRQAIQGISPAHLCVRATRPWMARLRVP